MDKHARLTHGFHGWHTKSPLDDALVEEKKKRLIGKRELIVVRSSQRGNN